MVIREAGILFRDNNLVRSIYIQKEIEIYNVYRTDLVNSLLNLVQDVFLTDIIEYLGGKEFVIAFIEDKIFVEDSVSNEPESLIIYCIFDNKKKVDKYVYKVVLPLLKKIALEFKATQKVLKSPNSFQTTDFKAKIDEILGDETKTIDQKLRENLF